MLGTPLKILLVLSYMVQEEESVASIYRGHSSIHVCWDTLGEYIATENTPL